MPYNPDWPQYGDDLTSIQLRAQWNGLKAFIDATPAGPPGPAGPAGPPGPGFSMRGDYVIGATYQPGEVVAWNGHLYVALQTTSEPPDVYPAWNLLTIAGPPGAQGPAGPPGQGLVMQGDWLDYQTYAPGDVVAYNNQTYVALTSAVGTPPDQAGNWRLLSITGPAGAPGEVSLSQLNTTLQTQCSRNCDAVQMIDGSSFSAEGQAIVAKINELLAVLHSPV